MRVIMTGGGTGGHIYPAVAIADEIRRRDENAEILFVGAEIGMEGDLVPKCGYEITLIPADGFNRKKLSTNFVAVKRIVQGTFKVKKIIKEFKPDVVIGTGGYASAPAIKTAQSMGIPTYIHEQNAFPGMSNKIQEKKARRVFLGFGEAAKYFKYPEKHVVCGNPVREAFVNADREKAREELGIKPDEFVLLAFGGSQGAARINKAMIEVIKAFNGVKDMKIYLGTGSYYYDIILKEFEDNGIKLEDNISVMEYIDDMPKYLAASDLMVGRSGALSVAEVTVCGVPAIFVPSPNVTGNHQFFNAKAVADNGGAIIIEEKDLENEALITTIHQLKNDRNALKTMAQKSKESAFPEAVKVIYDNVLSSFK
ncbi:MAG: undecaprenyldiphospho-muramoylpentapeptide beta-N-acetylglucosaminyltransferase [Firmicutes bacterium]|nr:undecaprenyldiphospho-muramoylpentapeptide beta-N-acetylglucosaminyltransferase [Bacillota bacterium]MBR6799658.1 undecaprenyldiphospho-muramoylpentapeptide beta-N-acetylglucosaminyltransferase [Bacillota bacterium]